MRARVTDQGVLVPKELLEGIDEVDIRLEQHGIVLLIVLRPVGSRDPLLELGERPVVAGIQDASVSVDRYLYGL